ncbi:hypothetical protein M011DRAFT_408065, partial [Sporormia fimetaria CBS 119925]
RTDSISPVKGAVAPVVTKQTFWRGNSQQWQRPFSSTATRNDDSQGPKGSKQPKEDRPKSELVSKDPAAKPASGGAAVSDATAKGAEGGQAKSERPQPVRKTPEERAAEKKAETAAQLAKLMADLEAMNPDNIFEAQRKGERGLPINAYKLTTDADFTDRPRPDPPGQKPGFWAEGQEELGPDEDYYGDDITSHGHGLLEEQRDLREYARMIAWELPLLNQLAKPFELPTAKTPFRFRYTSYLGERHPAANKVVVEFSVSDMPNLTQMQKDKLIKLAGPRYNPDTDCVKMSCEMFDSLPQNKRFLGDTISKLLAEARDGKDTFADVPFDFRHHKPKVRHEFPKEWILTAERKKYLEEKRQKMLKADDERTQNGTLIDGLKIIETSLPSPGAEREPVTMPAQRGKKKLLR